jgi:CRISPR associated protein Cas1
MTPDPAPTATVPDVVPAHRLNEFTYCPRLAYLQWVQQNVELRAAQFAAAGDGERSLALARRLVAAKIHNSRVLVRRNGEADETTLGQLRRQVGRAERATDLEQLLGCEGSAAQLYFSTFASMLKESALPAFDFTRRSRRPPEDPLNALLSFVYSLLTKDWTVVLHTVGFDPLMGFYHQPRYGKPALALDMMEPFRPVIAESVVIGAVPHPSPLPQGERGPDQHPPSLPSEGGRWRPRPLRERVGVRDSRRDRRRRFLPADGRRADQAAGTQAADRSLRAAAEAGDRASRVRLSLHLPADLRARGAASRPLSARRDRRPAGVPRAMTRPFRA